MNDKRVTVVEKTGEIIEDRPAPIILSDTAIEAIVHNMKQAEKLVFNVLEKDVDYGRLPGIARDGLWEPGADKIMNSFNVYPDYKILHHIEEDSLISFLIQSVLIDRRTQEVIGTGLGAASTREPKYKYRWEWNPEEYGYTPEEIKTFKFKDGKYRMPNPEYGELVNTLAKMAAKRADVAAAQSLPAVSSALRKLFGGLKPKAGPDWNSFWAQTKALGLESAAVHGMLNVKSIKEWVDSGKTLQDAIVRLAELMGNPPTKQGEASTSPPVSPPPSKERRDPNTVTEKDINNGLALQQIIFDCYGWQPKRVWAELNYSGLPNFEEAKVETAWQCFDRLKKFIEENVAPDS